MNEEEIVRNIKKIERDNKELNEWINKNNTTEIINNITRESARDGYINCLKYARENGCKWDKRTTAYAAKNEQIECLKYARENGCEWDEETTAVAALNGKIECLKYARENGCKWDEWTTKYATEN